ncbi:MAG: hypothetical protein LBF51_08580 [Zoogloeaceae bacterium]|nr:hypothetical protein [Zoogloeaceae bacterium]
MHVFRKAFLARLDALHETSPGHARRQARAFRLVCEAYRIARQAARRAASTRKIIRVGAFSVQPWIACSRPEGAVLWTDHRPGMDHHFGAMADDPPLHRLTGCSAHRGKR